MGSGHSHGPGAAVGHVGGKYRFRLALTFGMVLSFMLVELVVGVMANSLALISDAGHMGADAVALGAAFVATRIATRPDPTGRRSYGSYRAEIFASGLTVLIMLGVAVYVVVEALGRIGDEVEVETGLMLIVGLIGLGINVISMLLLRDGSKESLNVKGAYFEVVADAAGSVGVVVAGLLIVATGRSFWDTVVALAIGIFVAVRAIFLGRQVISVLAQHVPEGVVLDDVEAALEGIEGVDGVHDLHVWTLTSGMNVATAHLLLLVDADAQRVLLRAQSMLSTEHAIEHATLQTETARTKQCHEVQW